MVKGTDYLDTITVTPSRFPKDTRVDYKWPAAGEPYANADRVWGFMAINRWRDYAYWDRSAGGSVRISDIADLVQPFSWTFGGSGSFNLLVEAFLLDRTAAATGGDFRPYMLAEVGFFLHAPAATKWFFNNGYSGHPTSAIGSGFTDRFGITWKCRRILDGVANNYVMFLPADEQDRRSGTLDWRGAFSYLTANGFDYAAAFLPGIGFGIEPVGYAGTGWVQQDNDPVRLTLVA